jgi:hypothetical protein
MSEVQPLIADVSAGASACWKKVTEEANKAYMKWLAARLLDKMSIQPDTTVEQKHTRLEARVLTMLLSSVPTVVKQEAISTRELTCVQLLYKVLDKSDKGGAGQSPGRQKLRQLLRLQELNLQAPDPLLLRWC